jgi:hypothetical protein
VSFRLVSSGGPEIFAVIHCSNLLRQLPNISGCGLGLEEDQWDGATGMDRDQPKHANPMSGAPFFMDREVSRYNRALLVLIAGLNNGPADGRSAIP